MKNKIMKYIVLLVILIIVIFAVVLMLQNREKEDNGINNNNVGNVAEEENSNLETYKNEAYGIEFKYSKELKKPTIGNYSEINLEYPKIAGSEFFCNIPDSPNISYNKEVEIQNYIQTRESFNNSTFIKREETTISKIQPINCTLLEYETGAFTEDIYIIQNRAGIIYMGVTYPKGEPIKEFNDILDSIIYQEN
jgi:hypothetical protein